MHISQCCRWPRCDCHLNDTYRIIQQMRFYVKQMGVYTVAAEAVADMCDYLSVNIFGV